jgi:hypothetical protein
VPSTDSGFASRVVFVREKRALDVLLQLPEGDGQLPELSGPSEKPVVNRGGNRERPTVN